MIIDGPEATGELGRIAPCPHCASTPGIWVDTTEELWEATVLHEEGCTRPRPPKPLRAVPSTT